MEAVKSPFLFFPLFSSLPMQGHMWLNRNGSSFNSLRAALCLAWGRAGGRGGCGRRTGWGSGRVVLRGAVAPWECLDFSVRRFPGWGILVRNVVIHTQVKPEQVEVLLVLGALSNGGKPLMLIVQVATPCAAQCDSIRIL